MYLFPIRCVCTFICYWLYVCMYTWCIYCQIQLLYTCVHISKCVIVMNARVYFYVLVLKTCMYEHVCLNYKCMYPYKEVCTLLTNVFIVYMVVLYVSMYVCVEENTSHSHCEYWHWPPAASPDLPQTIEVIF